MSNRRTLNFNTHWKWINRDVSGGESPYLDESAAGAVDITVPHSHAIMGLTDLDPKCFQYVSWYRGHFTILDTYAGKRIRVQFQGTSQVATVYVNGILVGEHKGTYTSFIMDITDYVKVGDGIDNLIAVKIDATYHADIPPEGGKIDYFVYGGMTRDVNLIITDPLYADDVFIYSEKSGENVNVIGKITVINKYPISKNCKVKTTVIDAENNVVAKGENMCLIKESSACTFHIINKIDNPILWSPDNPYLYTVRTEVLDEEVCVDQVDINTGVRWIKFDPPGTKNGKFYINDQVLKLRGTNFHDVFPYVGPAAPKRLQRKDAHIIKYEMGANFVRAAHYPMNPEFLDECDRIGLLVVEEAPGWHYVGDGNWKDLFVNMLKELIIRDRNHPCIILWSVKVNENDVDDYELYLYTNAIAKGLDPSRPTTGIDSGGPKCFVTDVFSLTDYSNTNGKVPTRQPWITAEFNGTGPFTKALTFAFPNDSEYRKLDDMLGECAMLEFMLTRPDIAGFANWVLYDYLTPASNHTGHRTYQHTNLRCPGSFNILRAPKWNSYIYKSQAPRSQVGDVIFIASEWREDSYSTIYVASNCEQVELFKNGQSLGKISPNDFMGFIHPLFKWENVIWESNSSLIAKGYRDGVVVVEETRTIPGAPASLNITSTCSGDLDADGTDATWVIAELKDSNGQRVFDGDENIKIDISGPGEIVMYENPMKMMDGYAGFYVRSKTSEPGLIKCQASVDVGTVINDNVIGMAEGTIEYSAHWTHAESNGSYNSDYTYSNKDSTSDDYFIIKFNGTQIKLYGSVGKDKGIAAVSIDGGLEVDVNYYAMQYRDNVNVYTSPMLKPGYHELKVRVKMEKHLNSSGFSINMDRAKIHTGEYNIVSNILEITTIPVNEDVFVPYSVR